MSVNNLTLNKKGTRVKIVGKPRFYNILGTMVQWLPSFIYMAVKFDLFTFENQRYAITGWSLVGIGMIFLLFRQKIRDKFKEYEDEFGYTWKRAKSGNIALGIATALFVIYFLSYSFFLIFFIYAASTYASLTLYAPYDEIIMKKKSMQEMLDEKNKKEDFEKLTREFEELNSK